MISCRLQWSHCLIAALGFGAAALAVLSCSDANGGGEQGGAGGGTGTGGSSATGGTAGSGGYIGGSGGGTPGDGAVVTGDAGLPSGCATDSYTGELVPLDMYVLLDQSGSMGASDTDGGPSGWSQVTGAIAEFMALPGTAEIGMGMGFFPVESPTRGSLTSTRSTWHIPPTADSSRSIRAWTAKGIARGARVGTTTSLPIRSRSSCVRRRVMKCSTPAAGSISCSGASPW